MDQPSSVLPPVAKANGPRPEAAGVLRNPIGFLLVPQFSVLALASALEPLRIANRYVAHPYRWHFYSLDGQPVPDDNGILIAAEQAIIEASPPGTLLICADQHPTQHLTAELDHWLQRAVQHGTRMVSIDAAAFVLARAGLLDGHAVTMHWEVTSAFAECYPHIEVSNTLFELSARGPVSCAGGTAVLDLMLNLIEGDHGEQVAQKVAEHCIRQELRRGGDSQRMRPPHERLAAAIQAGESAPQGRMEIAQIAQLVGVSERQLLRLYRKYLGQTPSQFHLAQRLDRARAMLRSTTLSITDVSSNCGFVSAAHFARAFRKAYGHVPSAERARAAASLLPDAPLDEGRQGVASGVAARQTSRRRYS